MFSGGHCSWKYGLAMAQHTSSVVSALTARLENAAACYMAKSLRVCFKGFMGGAEAWDGSMSSLP
jgi:hypothetical protein